MSRLAAFGFESLISAIKKAIGTVPNTFAAIGAHGSAAFKAVPAGDAVPYLHITANAAVVAAGLVLFGLVLPTAAAAQQTATAVTDLSVSASATDGARHSVAARPDRNGVKPLTSHSPWLAPVGHRQPRRADIPQDETYAARERQQFRLDRELDRKLIICRCS